MELQANFALGPLRLRSKLAAPMASLKVLVVHGPNLNLLGEREGDERGRGLDELDAMIRSKAAAFGVEVKIFQSNHEGEIIDTLHAERRWADGVIINPGALTHSSYVLREALLAIGKPALEVHLTDIRRRESWRRRSVIKDVCQGQVLGKGFDSYLIALQRLASGDLTGRKRLAPAAANPVVSKSLGSGLKAAAALASPRVEQGARPGAAPRREPERERKTFGQRNLAEPERAPKTLGRRPIAGAPRAEQTIGRLSRPELESTEAAERASKPFGGVHASEANRGEKTLGRSDRHERAAERAPKELGRVPDSQANRGEKTLGRSARHAPQAGAKSLGSRQREGAREVLNRSLVRQKIADRLAGKLTAAGLATWARVQYLEVQRGAPAESGQRELLEDSLQSLTLSVAPASRLSEDQLIELMTQLDG